MNFSTKSNMYEANAQHALEQYGEFISGTGGEILLAISEDILSDEATQALDSSAAALGYGKRACAHLTIQVPTGGATAEHSCKALNARDMMDIVEGLDPVAIVAADGNAAALLCEAYRVEPAYDEVLRILGRTVVAFRNFESMLETSADKQRAWALLKKLPQVE